MSGSGSVFRHGTLRWTCAPRSKWALCLPQSIPSRSDKVPPLCDPDPLLIMDRLQDRPLGGRTGSTHSSKEWCCPLMNTHDRDMSAFMECDSLKQIRGNLRSLSSSVTFIWTMYCTVTGHFNQPFHCNCVFLMRQESMKLQRQKTLAKFWGVPSSHLIFLLKQQCAGFGFHLSFFSHFVGKTSTHLWPLITLNSALFHSVTRQSYRLSQSEMWCHWTTLFVFSLEKRIAPMSPDIA